MNTGIGDFENGHFRKFRYLHHFGAQQSEVWRVHYLTSSVPQSDPFQYHHHHHDVVQRSPFRRHCNKKLQIL